MQLLLALILAPAPEPPATASDTPSPAASPAPVSAPAPGIAPGRLAPPPSHVRLVGGHRLVQQADGSWTGLDRANGFTARIAVDGQLRFDGVDTGARPAHPWHVQARDPITGQPGGLNVGGPTATGNANAGSALGALLTAGVFKGLELGAERRHDRPSADEPLDPRDRFALDTATFREQLAAQWYATRLQASLDRLDHDLRGLWSDAIKPKTRRLAVFELWLRFPDSLPTVPLHPPPALRRELEARRAEIAVVGRDMIAQFTRTYLPRGTVEGYSRAELRRLNEGRGLDRFDPYATAGP